MEHEKTLEQKTSQCWCMSQLCAKFTSHYQHPWTHPTEPLPLWHLHFLKVTAGAGPNHPEEKPPKVPQLRKDFSQDLAGCRTKSLDSLEFPAAILNMHEYPFKTWVLLKFTKIDITTGIYWDIWFVWFMNMQKLETLCRTVARPARP